MREVVARRAEEVEVLGEGQRRPGQLVGGGAGEVAGGGRLVTPAVEPARDKGDVINKYWLS